MGAASDLDGASPAARPQEGFGRKLWRLASAYYSSEEWRSAWAITAAVVVLTLVQIGLQVQLTLSMQPRLLQRTGEARPRPVPVAEGAVPLSGARRLRRRGAAAPRAPTAAGLVARLAGAALARQAAGRLVPLPPAVPRRR